MLETYRHGMTLLNAGFFGLIDLDSVVGARVEGGARREGQREECE